MGASRVLSDWTTKLLDDTKGASNKIENPDLRLALTEGARYVARSVSEMLSHAKTLAPEVHPRTASPTPHIFAPHTPTGPS